MRALFTQVLLEKQEGGKALAARLPAAAPNRRRFPAKTVTAVVSPPKQGILFGEINNPYAIQMPIRERESALCKSHLPKSPKHWRW